MGVSTDSSNVMLPTTRHRPADQARCSGRRPTPPGRRRTVRGGRVRRSFVKRRVADVRAALRVGNRFAEEWYRQWLAWRWERSGAVVLFDRHFFVDYHAYDVDEARATGRGRSGCTARSWVGSTRGRTSSSISMRPGEVLLARKGEGTVEALERRRDEYRAIARHVPTSSRSTRPRRSTRSRTGCAEIDRSRLPGHAAAPPEDR